MNEQKSLIFRLRFVLAHLLGMETIHGELRSSPTNRSQCFRQYNIRRCAPGSAGLGSGLQFPLQ